MISYVPSLPTESACRDECSNTSGCNFYTYFLEGDLHQGGCYLLASLIRPLEECQTCVTGAMDCDNFNEDNCGFFYNGRLETHMMFTEPGVKVEFNTSFSLSSSCQIRVLAVGGGGQAAYDGGACGGGSGYIQFFDQNLTSLSPTLIELEVGNERGASEAEFGTNFWSILVLKVYQKTTLDWEPVSVTSGPPIN